MTQIHALAMVIVLLLLPALPQAAGEAADVPYSEFVARVDQGEVRRATVRGTHLVGTFDDGKAFDVDVLAPLADRLLAKGVTVAVHSPDEDLPTVLSVFVNWLPLLVVFAAIWLTVGRPVRALTRAIEAHMRATSMRSTAQPRASQD
jgi:cell division protease FtsH